ncbi:polynucleotide adenylyltransferase [Cardiosporidium cionae]|uniref:Polynucleotide adenylyltransferase n=1 Tax=Cardiosporidium cionae TaxID=476202 RepID=A0ABQ7JEE5_9APIC|nr:polynucleotide adenylyltransferase [Cardiosporidium cionae]|eukprot:KAF8822383.1 polynucleotide adenylyltransferase [Cardiosporidium cionae]
MKKTPICWVFNVSSHSHLMVVQSRSMYANQCFLGQNRASCVLLKKSISLNCAFTDAAAPLKFTKQPWTGVDTTDDEACSDHSTDNSLQAPYFDHHAIPSRILNQRKRFIEHLWRKDSVGYSIKDVQCIRNAISTSSYLPHDIFNSGAVHTLRALLRNVATEPPKISFKRRRSRKFGNNMPSSTVLGNSNKSIPSISSIEIQETEVKKDSSTTAIKLSENSHVIEESRHLPWIRNSYNATEISLMLNAKKEPAHVQLTKEIESLVISLNPLPISLKLKDSIISVITKEANLLFSTNCHIYPFGSVVNGFWTKNSDVDLCLQLRGCFKRTDQIKALRRFAICLQTYPTSTLAARFNAKVPIIYWSPKYEDAQEMIPEILWLCFVSYSHSNNMFVPDCSIGCDISVNNSLAIVNSKLIATYVKVDSRLKTLGIAVKTWAKSRGINDRSKGTLSSFAIILMLIHLLQHRPIPIFPSLQDIAISRHYTPLYLEGVDCRYCDDLTEVEEELHHARNGLPPNSETVGELLIEFYRYYAFSYKYGIISIRDTTALLHAIDPTAYYLCVDNPFEMGKDVANVTSEHYAHIRHEFRRAYTMLLHGYFFSHVCGATLSQ